jgi:hypothetical protein
MLLLMGSARLSTRCEYLLLPMVRHATARAHSYATHTTLTAQEFPPALAEISDTFDDPPLFYSKDSSAALDRVVIESLGRRGLWGAVEAMEQVGWLVLDGLLKRLPTTTRRRA